MSTNTYPEWQKAIREAQAKAKERDEKDAADRAEKAARFDKAESDALGDLLVSLGLPSGKQDGKARIVGGYRFSHMDGNSYHSCHHLCVWRELDGATEKLFSETDTYPRYPHFYNIDLDYRFSEDKEIPRLYESFSLRGFGIEAGQARLADMIDRVDLAYGEAVELAKARYEQPSKPISTPPMSLEERLLDVLREFIDEAVSERVD